MQLAFGADTSWNLKESFHEFLEVVQVEDIAVPISSSQHSDLSLVDVTAVEFVHGYRNVDKIRDSFQEILAGREQSPASRTVLSLVECSDSNGFKYNTQPAYYL